MAAEGVFKAAHHTEPTLVYVVINCKHSGMSTRAAARFHGCSAPQPRLKQGMESRDGAGLYACKAFSGLIWVAEDSYDIML